MRGSQNGRKRGGRAEPRLQPVIIRLDSVDAVAIS